MHYLLKDLNPQQREAVQTTEGPLLIIAGAGSGKTRVLTSRLAYILAQRLAEPYQILAVTFTNKAAAEMRERVNALLGGEIPALQVSTFHSFCARLLRREAEALGYDSNFTIFDADDSLSLIKSCIKELGISETQFRPKAQRRAISDAKNQMVSAESFAAQASGYFETRTAKLYSLYQKRLRACNGMDFDDLLFNAVVLLRDHKQIGDRYRQRFHYLMVDEYQDTNHVQYLLLKQLVGARNNICVVGDEDQSIYGWRGADIRNILDFERDFPGAKVIKLEQNYRSTATILNAASAVIANNELRKGKTLWTDAGDGEPITWLLVDSAESEAAEVVNRINSAGNGATLKETVILYRTNAQSRPFEEKLRQQNIPYQIVGGISFYQRKEIKDLLAYLKLLVNPRDDVSFLRVINYPKRGIGAKTIETISQLAQQHEVTRYEIVRTAETHPELSGKLRRLQPFAELMETFRAKIEKEPVDLLTENLVTELRLLEEIQNEDPVSGQTRVENIEAFIEGAAEYARQHADANLADYLSEISLFTDIDAYSAIENKLTLMTLHAAKGLEFDTVYMVGLEEGLFPLQRTITEPQELEEERRLFYVGATRARRRLVLSTASMRFRFGEVQSVPSRFVREIPKALMTTVDLRSARRYEFDRPVVPSRKAHAHSDETSGVHYVYDDEEMYRVGRIVTHPTFGRGKIVKAEGFGDSLRLEIMFTGIGVKKIMARFAKLKVVG